MSSTIKNKITDKNIQRQMTRQKAQEKSDFTQKHLNQLLKFKEALKENNDILRKSKSAEPVINHIVKNQVNTDEEPIDPSEVIDVTEPKNPDTASVEQNQIYTRQGRLDRISQTQEEREAQSKDLASTNDDNFYKVQDRGNQMSEDALGYRILAYSPESEKNNVRVSISTGKAIVSGSRRAENEFQEENRKLATNNFQTFKEEFTFDQPVAAEGMTRERNGDFIEIFIPKLNTGRT